MKLRNKKTGDIWEFEDGFVMKASQETTERAGSISGSLTFYADSLAELNEGWEDYKPSEPLIKDEKIRKAVRAWAEASGAISIVVFDCNNVSCLEIDEMEFAENGGRASISFKTSEKIDTSKAYTIEELCGEEEENEL